MKLDPATTALIVIDLQRGIVARQAAPHSAAEVVERCAKLAEAFRERNALVVLVHVAFADDRERLKPEADSAPPAGPLPPDWSDIVPEIGPRVGDIVITKGQWGAFYGTALDLQLRRRGIRTLVYGGIATNFGVESTARDAYERRCHVRPDCGGASVRGHDDLPADGPRSIDGRRAGCDQSPMML